MLPAVVRIRRIGVRKLPVKDSPAVLESLSIVEHFNVLGDLPNGLLSGSESAMKDQLGLQRCVAQKPPWERC